MAQVETFAATLAYLSQRQLVAESEYAVCIEKLSTAVTNRIDELEESAGIMSHVDATQKSIEIKIKPKKSKTALKATKASKTKELTELRREGRAALINMLKLKFPADEKTLSLMDPQHPLDVPNTFGPLEILDDDVSYFVQTRPITAKSGNTHIYIDFSNILLGYYELCQPGPRPMLDIANLMLIFERGRSCGRRTLVTSSPLMQRLDEAVHIGMEVAVLQRVKVKIPTYSSHESTDEGSSLQSKRKTKKAEQGVDELLHLKILQCLLEHSGKNSKKQTLVLATGDAASSTYNSAGFMGCVDSALQQGWHVEIYSWSKGLSSAWKPYIKRGVQVYSLDPFFNSLTHFS